MNIYINTIRNNLRVTKTKISVSRYTNKIWAQNVFSAIKSYYIKEAAEYMAQFRLNRSNTTRHSPLSRREVREGTQLH